jgi:hypothetical protein
MKTKVFIILLLCLFIVSCTKEKFVDNTVYVETPAELLGKWNWLETHGGIALVTYNPTNTGKSIRIELDSLNTYKYFSNDTLKYESKFHIAKTVSIFNHKDSALIIINEANPHYMNLFQRWNDFCSHCYFSFRSSDTLIFTDAAADGFEHFYFRIK